MAEKLSPEEILKIKKSIAAAIQRVVTNSHGYQHIDGTTQTTTNDLDATYEENGETIHRTTRQAHSRQVAACSSRIARKCGLSSYDVLLADLTAQCHDIGHCI